MLLLLALLGTLQYAAYWGKSNDAATVWQGDERLVVRPLQTSSAEATDCLTILVCLRLQCHAYTLPCHTCCQGLQHVWV